MRDLIFFAIMFFVVGTAIKLKDDSYKAEARFFSPRIELVENPKIN